MAVLKKAAEGRTRARFVVLSVLVLAVAARVLAGSVASEEEVKAAFLYNFAKFVEWPARAFPDNDTIVLGVVADESLGAALDRIIEGKTAGGRALVIKRLSPTDAVRSCQVLFIGESYNGRVGPLLDALGQEPVLTVGEQDEFLEKGGMISFAVRDKKLRFSVNTAAASRVGLKISSQLTKLALKVVQ